MIIKCECFFCKTSFEVDIKEIKWDIKKDKNGSEMRPLCEKCNLNRED